MTENIGEIDPNIAREEAKRFAVKMADIHRIITAMPDSVLGFPDDQEEAIVYLPSSGIAVVQDKPTGYRSLVIKMAEAEFPFGLYGSSRGQLAEDDTVELLDARTEFRRELKLRERLGINAMQALSLDSHVPEKWANVIKQIRDQGWHQEFMVNYYFDLEGNQAKIWNGPKIQDKKLVVNQDVLRMGYRRLATTGRLVAMEPGDYELVGMALYGMELLVKPFDQNPRK